MPNAYAKYCPPKEEMLNGKIVAMAGALVKHNEVSQNVFTIFRNHLRKRDCKVFVDGTKLFVSEKDHVYPDVMIVCDKDKIGEKGIHGAPDLVVEVLSRSTYLNDKGYKKILYEKHGVKEYWLVDISNFIIEVNLLKDGKFEVDNAYHGYNDEMVEKMDDEEKAMLVESFKTSLFDDLVINVNDVFEGLL